MKFYLYYSKNFEEFKLQMYMFCLFGNCFSSSQNAHSDKLSLSESINRRLDDVIAELYLQFYFYAQFKLAFWWILLRCE